jgi:hypothetical protein
MLTMHCDREGRVMRPAALAVGGLFALAAVGAAVLWVGGRRAASPLAGPEALAAASVRALEAGHPRSAELTIARELAWGERRPSAWCRLAYARYLESGRVDERANAALLRSYEVAPLDADAFAWRVRFVFGNWSAASPQVRRHAMAEARAFHAQWPTRPVIEAAIGQVRDPVGRFALSLAVRGAEPKAR